MIVLDSSFLIAFYNERDVHHAAAQSVRAAIASGRYGEALLPEYVFLEVVTVLAARRGLPKASAVGAELLETSEVEFIPCTDVFADAFARFRSQRAGRLSFADSAIVEIAKRRGVEHVATFDADFSKTGLAVVSR